MGSLSLGRIIGLLFFSLSFISFPVQALEIGTCDTPEGLSEKLRAEGHRIVATMDRLGIFLGETEADDREGYEANLVTANGDLSRWYMLRGDKPLGEVSSRICVSLAGNNLEINDYRQDGPPTVTHYEFDRERALAECDEVAKNFPDGEENGIGCNSYNEGLAILERGTGERIALQGLSDLGGLMTIIADPLDSQYRLLATARQGATGISARGDHFSFADWVVEVLDNRLTAKE